MSNQQRQKSGTLWSAPNKNADTPRRKPKSERQRTEDPKKKHPLEAIIWPKRESLENENILKIELKHKSCLDLTLFPQRKSKKVITKLVQVRKLNYEWVVYIRGEDEENALKLA